MTKTASFAAAAGCAFFTVTAQAMPSQPAKVELINYAGLDLGSKVDQARLKWQIHLAGMRVCTLGGFLALSCYDTATADALRQLNRAIVEHVKKTSSVAEAVVSVGRRNADPGPSSDR